jgi:membrane protease YdiL (CAAX protease family)
MTGDLVGPSEPADDPFCARADEPPPGPKRSAFREMHWSARDVIVGFLPDIVTTVCALVINPAMLWVGPAWLWLPFAVIQLAWLLLYPLWIMRRRATLPRLPRPRTVVVEAIYAFLATVLVMVLLNMLFSALIHRFGERASPTMPYQGIASSPHWYDWLGFLGLSVVLAPLAEEVFYRGMFYSALRRRLPVAVAAPAQAIVFGLSHHFGPSDTAGVCLIGLVFALLYEWRKTLLAPMLMHAFVNALAMAIMSQSAAADAAAPRLGVIGEAHERGVSITSVGPDTAAAKAGLRIGDVIVSLDGEHVADLPGLTRAVRRRQVGQTVVIEYLRGMETHTVEAVLKKLRE